MSGQFDAYEYTAIIVPGAALLLGLIFLFPKLWPLIRHEHVNLGGVAILVIASFVIGQVVHEAGGLFSYRFLREQGMLSSQSLLQTEQAIVGDRQYEALARTVKKRLGVDLEKLRKRHQDEISTEKQNDAKKLNKTALEEWTATTRQIYVQVRAANRHERIDAFNRTYGLCRSLIFVCILLGIAGVIRLVHLNFSTEHRKKATASLIGLMIVILIVSGVVLYKRAQDYNDAYARELFLTYLSLPAR